MRVCVCVYAYSTKTEFENPVDILRGKYVSLRKHTKTASALRAFISRALYRSDLGTRKSLSLSLSFHLVSCSISGDRVHRGWRARPRRAAASPASCDLHQQRRALQERGYIITTIGKRSSLRCDGSATTGGCFRVGCHGDTLGPLPRGCSLEYPPSCLFSAIPSPPACPPSASTSWFPRSFAPSRSLLTFIPPPPSPTPPFVVRVFLPRYTYVFTRPPSIPCHPVLVPAAPPPPALSPLLFPG